jgi:hypothetical protein
MPPSAGGRAAGLTAGSSSLLTVRAAVVRHPSYTLALPAACIQQDFTPAAEPLYAQASLGITRDASAAQHSCTANCMNHTGWSCPIMMQAARDCRSSIQHLYTMTRLPQQRRKSFTCLPLCLLPISHTQVYDKLAAPTQLSHSISPSGGPLWALSALERDSSLYALDPRSLTAPCPHPTGQQQS